MFGHGVILVAVLVTAYAGPVDHPCVRPCFAGQTMSCRYNFTVEWYRTLSKACYECPFNVTDCYREECVAADGKIRALLTINRQIPGPSIEVCEGDEVVVAVTNMLEDGLATSIHWHGQHVTGTPYMDGVGQVTQCHIMHLETFTYKFLAAPAGTHWYHAHTGLQLADGLFGAFIVRQQSSADPNSGLYDLDLPQHVVLAYDWLPELSMPRYVTLMHDLFDVGLPRSVLVNGRGRGYNVTDTYNIIQTNLTHAQTPLEVLHVQKERKYRLRFIAVAPTCPLQVSVDEHQLLLIAVDGMPLQPRVVDAFIMHPGERYDFVLNASKDVGNYWLRVLGLGDCEFPLIRANGAAILRYEGARAEEPPGNPNLQRDGILLNPILFDRNVTEYGFNRTVILTDDMRYGRPSNYTNEKVDFKYIVGMDFNNNDNTKYNNRKLYPVKSLRPIKSHFTPVMDNITFNLPPIPILSQPEDVRSEWFCNRSTIPDPEYCLNEDLCQCTHLLKVKRNQVVELIVYHEGRIFTERGHNMHLHGHSFRLLGLGKVGKSLSRSLLEEMDSRGALRRNYIQPPVRDTVNVPDGGYAIIRFTANNPGFWFFHCHTDSHLQQGMALLIQVGDYSDLPPVPEEFPRCGGMGYSNARKQKQVVKDCPTNSAMANLRFSLFSLPMALVLYLLLFFVLQPI